jgi:peptidoglycan hydrolase-like protein with peptidoglycan-binding domain
MEIPTQIGLKLGHEGKEVGRLQSYLKKFGYIRPDKEMPFGLRIDLTKATKQPKIDSFDDTTQEALKQFQKFNRLPITGILDKATVNLMLKPRCGLPDLVVPEGLAQDYVYSGMKWAKLALTYQFQNYTPDLPQDVAKRAIKDGFDQWSSATPLSFSEVPSGGDLKIAWATGDHGDGNPFDGPSGILAHSFYPQDGRVHFDDDEMWSDSLIPVGVDLASVAVHELGHALGLAHSNDPLAVMYAYYSGRRRSLTSDDIAGIQSIYGSKTGGGTPCTIANVISTSPFIVMRSKTQFLREFRDEVVLKSKFKVPFERILNLYYQCTPTINKTMETSSLFRRIVKWAVYSFVISTKEAADLTVASMRIRNYRNRQ